MIKCFYLTLRSQAISNFVDRFIRFSIVASLLAGLFVVAPAPRALAATITVTTTNDELNSDGDCSLREAIQAANTDSVADACPAGSVSQADTIIMPSGTYTLAIAGQNEDGSATGDLDITGDLTINGAGANITVVDGNNIDRVVHVLPGATVIISGVTLTGGKTPDGAFGGGVYNLGALTLSNSAVKSSTAYASSCINSQGGGVYNAGSLTVSNSSVVSNTATLGGGILNSGALTITGSTINGNNSSNGGGVRNSGTLTVTSSVINGNQASVFCQISLGVQVGNLGGGVFNLASLTLTDSSIGNNVDNGGSIYNYPASAQTIIVRSTVNWNSHVGVINQSGVVELSNSTISGNGREGIKNITSGGQVTLVNSTATANAGNNGGLVNASSATFVVRNSIVAGNLGTATPDISGSFTSDGYNLIGKSDGGIGFTNDVNGDQVGTSAMPINPQIGPLQNNGGPTQTHALLPGSPAIDAGNPATPGSGGSACLTTDQRGNARPQGVSCDIGAYELVVPTLNFPSNSDAPPTTRPLFDWANIASATSYTLQISTNQNFSSFVLNTNLTPSAYVPTTGLPRNTLLFWRVRANGPGGPSAWSRVRHFFSANPSGVPSLLAPANGATVASNQPMLDWRDSTPAASYYEVQISTDANFAAILGRGQGGRVNLSAYTPEVALGSGPFFWRVRAVSGGASSGGAMQFSQWSAVRSFQTPP